MAVLSATTVGLIVWVVLWSLGVKAFDGIWIVIAIVVAAATAKIVTRYLPGRGEA